MVLILCRGECCIEMTSIQHDLLVGDNPTMAHWANTGVITKGVQDLAMSTDFNAHLITSRQPSEECKSKVLLNLEAVFPNYEANLTPDLFRL